MRVTVAILPTGLLVGAGDGETVPPSAEVDAVRVRSEAPVIVPSRLVVTFRTSPVLVGVNVTEYGASKRVEP